LNKIQIQCSTIALKKSEILSIIPDSVKRSLSLQDKDYESKLKPYTLCHEGQARPSIFDSTGKKSIVMQWSKDTVRGFISKLKSGLQFFAGHNPTNDNQSNTVLGSLVAFSERIINGSLSAIGIGYFPNSESVRDMDVISAEFDVLNAGMREINGVIEVAANAIGEITGLALGSRANGMKPAFPMAESLQVQAFEFIKEEKGEKKLDRKELLETLTIDEIKNVVRNKELRITQVFDANSIFEVEETENGEKRFKTNDSSANKWLKDHLKDFTIVPKSKLDAIGDLDKKYKELEKSYQDAKPHYIKSIGNEKFSEYSKAKNLEANKDKLSFVENKIRKGLDKFNGSDKDLEKYIEEIGNEASTDYEEYIVKGRNGFQPINTGLPSIDALPEPNSFKL
jgi:hypothetical protein